MALRRPLKITGDSTWIAPGAWTDSIEKQTEGCTPLSCGRLMHHILGRILGQPGDGADLEHLAVAT